MKATLKETIKGQLPVRLHHRLRRMVLSSGLYRSFHRSRFSRRLDLPSSAPTSRAGRIAALVRIKNEDYWIELILRTVCRVMDEVVVIDTGSEDHTLEILDALKEEGLPMRIVRHREHPRHLNLIANLVADRTISSEYLYVVDGDEIQLESSLMVCQESVRSASRAGIWYIATHHLFVHPEDVTRCTRPFSPQVRHRAGRILSSVRLCFSEMHINDGTVIKGQPLGAELPASRRGFLADAYTLHMPLNRRSTIRSWAGQNSLVGTRDYRENRYVAEESEYIGLPFFPKEIAECRFSSHNHYLQAIRESAIDLI